MTDKLTLQFVTERGFVSGIVRWFSHSDISHVDLVLEEGQLLGAHIAGGVAIRPANYGRWSRVIRLDLPTAKASACLNWAFAQQGKPYDWGAIWGFLIDRNWREEDSWTCSELVARALEIGRYFPAPLIVPTSRITPGDLYFLLSTYGQVVADRRIA